MEKNPVPFQEIKVTLQEGFILDNANSKYTKEYATCNILSTCLPSTPEQILTLFNVMCSESPYKESHYLFHNGQTVRKQKISHGKSLMILHVSVVALKVVNSPL